MATGTVHQALFALHIIKIFVLYIIIQCLYRVLYASSPMYVLTCISNSLSDLSHTFFFFQSFDTVLCVCSFDFFAGLVRRKMEG
jgi:hypothetical protein